MHGRRIATLAVLIAAALAGCASSGPAKSATQLTPAELAERTLRRRAIEAVIWGMPVVNTDLMRQEMLRKTGGKENEILYWSRPADANNQTLTPNPDCIYFLVFYNTKNVGPVVIELPPADTGSFAGSIMTFWQMPMADIGPDGEDQGRGGKYLVLPPGFKGAPPDGHFVLRSDTDAGYALPEFNPGIHWTLPAMPDLIASYGTSYGNPDAYPVDSRGLGYTYAFVGIRKLGAAQFYLISIKDKDGRPYEGNRTYRLRVPANPPVKNYWSVTSYDRQLHTVIKGMPYASRSSQIADLQKNADGSVDIYIGPAAPAGKTANWLPTDPARRFDLMFRFYGPTPELMDRTWKLPDVEAVN